MSATQPVDVGRPTPHDVFAVVRDAVATVLEREPEQITRETSFADLHADSLALVELAEIVEERLAPLARSPFRIPDDELERLATVGDIVDAVMARV